MATIWLQYGYNMASIWLHSYICFRKRLWIWRRCCSTSCLLILLRNHFWGFDLILLSGIITSQEKITYL
jgi:hypothetical protein